MDPQTGNNANLSAAAGGQQGKTIELIYQKKQSDKTYVPALYRIFDAILVNAADNMQRDPTMDTVKVCIDPKENAITVYNNGEGVPIDHKESGVHLPEFLCGILLTSSNYDATFSKEFTIETVDRNRQKRYRQVFTDNMRNKSEPEITDCKSGEEGTTITFKPDLAKFGMERLEDDVVALMKKRVVDLAGRLGGFGVNVELNDEEGLGTSSSDEGKEYFRDLKKRKKDFVWTDDSKGAIELAFSKETIEDRKEWLQNYDPGKVLNPKDKEITYTNFVNRELIHFSMANLQRSIPSVMDGLKHGQRKVLFSAFKCNLIEETLVSHFGIYVAENSAYHHGEMSLSKTIIGMAQDFVGSNNINIFQPNGQFGTRCKGGKDHANPRIIYTCLNNISRFLFPKEDDVLLNYLTEDGLSIEPTWYAPIIPMVLVNGAKGIGTGWSTFIPSFNPREIIVNIRHLLKGESMGPMHPWYKGFTGIVERSSTKEDTFTCTGRIEAVGDLTVRITELPVHRWTYKYKQLLESIVETTDKRKRFIKDFRDHSTDKVVRFDVDLEKKVKEEKLVQKFKLTTSISTANMHLFDSSGKLKKYSNAKEILEEFYHLRFAIYEKRKKYYVDDLEKELLKLENKVKFINAFMNGEIFDRRKSKSELLEELRDKGYPPIKDKAKSVDSAPEGSDYDYLLSISVMSFTDKEIEDLEAERANVSKALSDMRTSSVKSMWLKDLQSLEDAFRYDYLLSLLLFQCKFSSSFMPNINLRNPQEEARRDRI